MKLERNRKAVMAELNGMPKSRSATGARTTQSGSRGPRVRRDRNIALMRSFTRYDLLKSEGSEILTDDHGVVYLVIRESDRGFLTLQMGFPEGITVTRHRDTLIPASDYQIGIIEGTVTPK